MRIPAAILIGLLLAAVAAAQDAPVHRVFHVKYVAEGVVYLDGGRNAGLAEHQVLKVSPAGLEEGSSRGAQLAAEEIASVRVLSLADASAVCEILSSAREIQPGDVALLLAGADPAAAAPKPQVPYLQIVSFTTDDPLEDERRAAVPRPPLPEINRARGRIGLEYNTLLGHTPTPTQSSTLGLVFRANMTRIGGTYWNFNGYWRGRLNRRDNSQTQTVSDLLNRTYQLGFTYNNPFSSHVAGIGRLYLPWASSLEILDGGYAGLRSAKGTVAGIFAGTTPDPTSWDYSPNRKLAGAFLAIERGSFDDAHLLSTTGIAVSAIDWRAERQFAFTENTFSYRRVFTAYESMQVDAPHSFTAASPAAPSTPVTTRFGGINRSYMTLRVQPIERLSFDLNHSYFRGVPTFDPVLIGTGLLDRYLFQGLSGGVRAEAIKKVTLYANLGRSSRCPSLLESALRRHLGRRSWHCVPPGYALFAFQQFVRAGQLRSHLGVAPDGAGPAPGAAGRAANAALHAGHKFDFTFRDLVGRLVPGPAPVPADVLHLATGRLGQLRPVFHRYGIEVLDMATAMARAVATRWWLPAVALLLWASSAAAQEAPGPVNADLLRRAGIAAQQFIEHMGSVRYAEHLAQRELKESGKVNYQQDAFFDALTLVRRENGGLVADESSEKERPADGFEIRPLLRTSGFSTLALIVHPYYQQSFRFSTLNDEVVAGRSLRLVHFEHVKGAESPTALRLRGRDYPLDLSGVLWLDRDSGAVVRVVALLSEPLDDIGLRSLNCDVQYAPVALPETPGAYWLPESATIELRTPKQHWRNVHTYSNYRKYSVDVVVGTGETQP
jgi:hypothetical protein